MPKSKPRLAKGLISKTYAASTIVLFCCFIVQLYLAGQAATTDAAVWLAHVEFVKVFWPLCPIVAILAWVAHRSAAERVLATLLVPLILLQGLSANLSGWVEGVRWIAGYHAVGGTLLTVTTLFLAVTSFRKV